jgi:hypothetical protein
MALTLRKITSNTANVSFLYDEETVNLTYYPSHITEKTFVQLQSFNQMNSVADVETGFAELNVMLANLVKDWNVYEDDAETIKLPISADHFADLPIPFRLQILGMIMQDFRPEATAPQTLN